MYFLTFRRETLPTLAIFPVQKLVNPKITRIFAPSKSNTMAQFRHLDHKNLVAFVRVVSELIRVDNVIDAEEIQMLMQLEQQYGFDRTYKREAIRLTLADAVSQLSQLDLQARTQILEAFSAIAGADRVCVTREAIMLLALRYCLEGKQTRQCQVIDCPASMAAPDQSPYVMYVESDYDDERHEQIDSQMELIQLMLQQSGLRLFYVEQIVSKLSEMDKDMMLTTLGYLAPELDDMQVTQMYERMQDTDTATFTTHVLARDLQMTTLRNVQPSLLISMGSAFLRITLQDDVRSHLKSFLQDFGKLVSPNSIAHTSLDAGNDKLRYFGYYKAFIDFILKAEPKESHLVIWPLKSEFEFPEAHRTLRLNQQEASLYTLILEHTYKHDGKGLPLCYTPAQKRIEALYRTIYCCKKCVDEADVIYPDNLAPIRAKIEKKMRDQLTGISNLEDYIPHNDNRQGYYRIAAHARNIKVKADIREEEVDLQDYNWR